MSGLVHQGTRMLNSIAPRFAAWLVWLSLTVPGWGAVCAQEYPTRTVRIVTSEPGGSSDIAARLIAQGISGPLGQQAIVENRPGTIAIDSAARAQPDGYTLLLYGSVIWIEPLLRATPLWDAVRDFAPITTVTRSPNIAVVHPSLPAKSIKEFIALAKSRPGELNYGSAPVGSTQHLAGELFKAMAGVKIVHVPYKGAVAALNDVLAGRIELMFPTIPSAMPLIKQGRLRALAVTSAQPSPHAPGVPTVTASGLPGYESVSLLGMLAPAKTSAAIINRLNQEIVQVLRRSEVKERFFNLGLETVDSSPEQLAATIQSEIAKWTKVIRSANIPLQ